MTQTADQNSKTVADYIALYRRRRSWFWIPAATILGCALLAAILLPPTYRSVGRILIEDQEISSNLIGETVTSFATQQIQMISQRALTETKIRQIVEEFGIYDIDSSDPDVSNSMIAVRFRGDMGLNIVRADVIDPRSRAGQAAIGFNLAFSSSDPEVAQSVAEELVTLFLEENVNRRQERAEDVSKFLADAAARANAELERTEAELAAFKSANEGALPEDYEENASNVQRAEQQLSDTDLRIRQLDQRVIELSAQLSTLDPSSPVASSAEDTMMSDRDRLRMLSAEYRQKSARYRPGHPDLARLEREIAALQASVGDGDQYTQLTEQLEQERELLAARRLRYSENHPDVVRSQATIDRLGKELQGLEAEPEPVEVANNPAYLVVSTQLQSSQVELRSLREQQQRLREKVSRALELIKRSPEVEVKYEGLRRQYDNAKMNFSELQTRLRAAEVADDVEEELLRGRFRLIEPPSLPLRPISPNRPAILMFGLILAVGIGGVLVLLSEAFDNRIYGSKAVEVLVGGPPLVTVPYLNNSADLAAAKRRRLAYAGAVGLVFISMTYLLL